MPPTTIHYPVAFPDEVHTDFDVWLSVIRNELNAALVQRKQKQHITHRTHHRSAYALTGEGFTCAIVQVNAHNPPPEVAGHEGLKLSLQNTLYPELKPYGLTFVRMMWQMDSYELRLKWGATLKRGSNHAEPLPMAQCWRLLYIIEPAPQGGLITPPPEPLRPPDPQT